MLDSGQTLPASSSAVVPTGPVVLAHTASTGYSPGRPTIRTVMTRTVFFLSLSSKKIKVLSRRRDALTKLKAKDAKTVRSKIGYFSRLSCASSCYFVFFSFVFLLLRLLIDLSFDRFFDFLDAERVCAPLLYSMNIKRGAHNSLSSAL